MKANNSAYSDANEHAMFSVPFPQWPWTLKSPFGPVSSSACYEELSSLRSVNLLDLWRNGIGMCMQRTKMYVTVVTEAFVSATPVVSMVVEDDSGQCVMMQIFNLKDAKPTNGGIEAFPIGARFCLKSPFLKLGNDGWLLLRVDQPFDLQRLDIPPLTGSILIVGDGDFSYSLELARKNKACSSTHITATSIDSKDDIEKKYFNGRSNLAELNANPKVTVLHNVDATVTEDLLQLNRKYDSIVWNFPYPVDAKGWVSSSRGSELVLQFLKSAKCCLLPNGLIYVTLAKFQGGTTREASAPRLAWDMEEVVHQAAGLELVEVLPFGINDFVDYEPKRAYTDSTFPYDNCKTHIIKTKQSSIPGEAPSDRTIISRLMNFAMDRIFVWYDRTHNFLQPLSSVQVLQDDVDRSPIARDLLGAALAFQSAVEALPSTAADFHSTDETMLNEMSSFVSHQLWNVFNVRHGELVVMWTDDLQVSSAQLFSEVHVAFVLGELRIAGSDDCLYRFQQIAGVGNRVSSSAIEMDELQRAFFVLASVKVYSGIEEASRYADVGCKLFPNDPFIFNFRAMLNMNRYSIRKEGVVCANLKQSIIDDCNQVMGLVLHDHRNHLYQDALYTLASANRLDSLKHIESAVEMLEKYVGIVDQTDRHLPTAHYHIGSHSVIGNSYRDDFATPTLTESALEKARYHYTEGLKSETLRLKFFGPVVSESKDYLSVLIMLKNDQVPNFGVDKSYKHEDIQKEKPTKNAPKLDKILCSAAEVRDLINDKGDIEISDFYRLYQGKYGKNPFRAIKMKKALMELAKTEIFLLEKRSINGTRSSIWLTLPAAKINNAGRACDGNHCTPREVRDLLYEQNEINLNRFKSLYKKKYGKQPVKDGVNLAKHLRGLENPGLFSLEYRDNRTSLWITKGGKVGRKNIQKGKASKRASNNQCTAGEVRSLLDECGEIYVGRFRKMYQDKYGKPPVNIGTKVTQHLRLLEKSGLFKLEHRVNRSELWIKKAK